MFGDTPHCTQNSFLLLFFYSGRRKGVTHDGGLMNEDVTKVRKVDTTLNPRLKHVKMGSSLTNLPYRNFKVLPKYVVVVGFMIVVLLWRRRVPPCSTWE